MPPAFICRGYENKAIRFRIAKAPYTRMDGQPDRPTETDRRTYKRADRWASKDPDGHPKTQTGIQRSRRASKDPDRQLRQRDMKAVQWEL